MIHLVLQPSYKTNLTVGDIVSMEFFGQYMEGMIVAFDKKVAEYQILIKILNKFVDKNMVWEPEQSMLSRESKMILKEHENDLLCWVRENDVTLIRSSFQQLINELQSELK